MLPTESKKALSFKRYIEDGHLVIVYERHDVMKPVKVTKDGVLQNRFGFGTKVVSNKGKFVYLLAPTSELWTLVLSHRTQTNN